MKSIKKKSETTSKPTLALAKDYTKILLALKRQIYESQIKAAVWGNKELIKLHYSLGKTITEKQEISHWGSQIIERLVKDLQNAFPGIEGFSRSNIFRMKAFFLAYEKVAQAVPLFENLPVFRFAWGHNILLLRKLKNTEEMLWYAQDQKIIEKERGKLKRKVRNRKL